MKVVQDLSQFGKVILGRDQMIEIVRHLNLAAREIRASRDGHGYLILQLDGLDGIDYPAADELIRGVYSIDFRESTGSRVDPIFVGGRENVVETLAAASRDRSRVLFHFPDTDSLRRGEWQILGDLPRHLYEAMRELHLAGPMSAEDLANRLEITLGAAQNRLTELRQRQLVARRPGDSPRKYLYEFRCTQRL